MVQSKQSFLFFPCNVLPYCPYLGFYLRGFYLYKNSAVENSYGNDKYFYIICHFTCSWSYGKILPKNCSTVPTSLLCSSIKFFTNRQFIIPVCARFTEQTAKSNDRTRGSVLLQLWPTPLFLIPSTKQYFIVIQRKYVYEIRFNDFHIREKCCMLSLM